MIAARLPFVPPEAALAAFAGTPDLAFLDSAARHDPRAQTSYLCLAPRAVLRLETDPYTRLRRWMAGFTPPPRPADWPFAFAGGAVGWIGYDLARRAAGLPSRFAPLPGLPGGWFGLYTQILGFDLARRELVYLGPAEELASVAARLLNAPAPPPPPALAWRAETPPPVYRQRHEALKAYIGAGDIYQANLTLRFTAPRPPGLSLAALHHALRRLSPAPFGACLEGGGCGLACASPERFLRLYPDGRVETRPIKGTAARHPDPEADARAAAALRANPKERAENLMITDLLRNDLGKVCETGSVRVPELWSVESYAQAHHLVSAVTGRLRPGLDAFDLLAATLPGGSITGAPKHRAMEIIDELEAGPRGAYCGTLAWIGFDGAMDSAIIIRTLTATADTLYAQAGGGITWDSTWSAEHDEAMIKISPLLALGQ
ncbi:anthranilate synthase component I family protein [Acidocella sp.]|uniref:anthranilate synthase component I family protein n=1 Tax=Acidocella sp. TaxID=50710 RepID=UPI002637C72B|nr:anthranilate synthase component I family protein [Acidocella sp.]